MKFYSRLSENAQACQVLHDNLSTFLKGSSKNMLDEEGYNNLIKNLSNSIAIR
jgi:hypothetical protein